METIMKKRKPSFITRREFKRELQHLQRDLDHLYAERQEDLKTITERIDALVLSLTGQRPLKL